MTNKLDEVRAAIIKAVPEIGARTIKVLSEDEKSFREAADSTIRLADMLAATPAMIEVSSHAGGAIYHYPNGDHAPRKSSGVFWNLRTDDLSLQSPAFIDFAHSLLCV